MKVHCIGNILFRNGLLRHSTEEIKRKYARDGNTWKKSEHLLDDSQEIGRYWKLKQEAINRNA